MSSFSPGDDDPAPAEWTVVALSVALTFSLFGYVGWHAATTPASAPPEVTVTGTETLEDGRVSVIAELYNPASTGLESATIAIDCSDESITFRHVPTDARLSGRFVCPAGTEDPSVSVKTWVESQGSRTN